jgi:hypothetical protein
MKLSVLFGPAMIFLGTMIMVGNLHATALESLEERVTEYWQARISNDLVAMYELEEASIGGQTGLQSYIKGSGGIAYNSAEIKALEWQGDDQAAVQLVVEYKVLTLPGDWFSTVVNDTWIMIDGTWYHRDRKSVDNANTDSVVQSD